MNKKEKGMVLKQFLFQPLKIELGLWLVVTNPFTHS